jgi:hypothetical protein
MLFTIADVSHIQRRSTPNRGLPIHPSIPYSPHLSFPSHPASSERAHLLTCSTMRSIVVSSTIAAGSKSTFCPWGAAAPLGRSIVALLDGYGALGSTVWMAFATAPLAAVAAELLPVLICLVPRWLELELEMVMATTSVTWMMISLSALLSASSWCLM